jgi:hypothetical protein
VARRAARRARRYFSRRYRSHRKSKKIPLLTVAGVAAGFLSPAATSGGGKSPVQNIMDQQWTWAQESLIENFTGYNTYTKQFNIMNAHGLIATVAGALASKIVGGSLGVNKKLSNVPVIGKYLAL